MLLICVDKNRDGKHYTQMKVAPVERKKIRARNMKKTCFEITYTYLND